MHFVKTSDSVLGQSEVVSILSSSLQKGPTLWIISGGSNIPIEVNILNDLEGKLTANLYILLSDERYGPQNHKSSNYYQLKVAGMNLKQAIFPDILDQDLSPEGTLSLYSKTFQQFKSQAITTIAQLGIGTDGHIAGVLPHSSGIKSTDTAIYYESDTLRRLSLTLNTLKSIEKVRVFCFGENKLPALTRLKKPQESIDTLPCLILNEIPDVTVYNDQLED